MPRGVPKTGFRMTARRMSGSNVVPMVSNSDLMVHETDEEISTRIRERFDVFHELAMATISGDSRALIASGPPGLGKSFTVERILENKDESEYRVARGFVRATGLYRLLYETRHKNSVLVLDDSDSVFFDDVTLNLLKAACDTTERRRVSWRAETKMRDEDEDPIPTVFDYEGSVIFITNYDFDRMIQSGHKLAEHLSALVSRAHYLSLTLRTKRDFIVRIKQVIEEDGMLSDRLTKKQINEVVAFIEKNSDNLWELSLRMAIKIASIMKANPGNWERTAKITCLRS